MPRPLYIVCCEAGSEDRRTGLLSHFQLYEKITLRRLPLPQGRPVVMSLPMRVVAVWMKFPDDPQEQEYDFEMAFYLPDGREVIPHRGTFAFEPAAWQYRIAVHANTFPPGLTTGTFRIECRIRRAGTTEDWVRQDYPILVEEENIEEPAEEANQ